MDSSAPFETPSHDYSHRMSLLDTLSKIEEMHLSGVINQYAIGGAIAAGFYLEPVQTEDVDIFVLFDSDPTDLNILAPIYNYAQGKGWKSEGLYIIVGEWPVQFLPHDSPLTKEAIENACEKTIGDFRTKVFTPEHLMAIALKLGRPKDKIRLAQFHEESKATDSPPLFDQEKFEEILKTHKLEEKWKKFKTTVLES